ncbi:MAG: hypothetical protein NPIRA02_32530 [Nitrospirales bacterium]|nr:MAG: hypothetical protein NPIRA02_32530 [Nitrospirales bacterium]
MWPFPDQTISKPESFSANNHDSGTTVQLRELIDARHAITALGMGAKKGVYSLLAGGERSPFKGRGVDFDEVRRYQGGDDVRHMDWRVTARSGEPHLKIFREERERPVFIVVDYSHSMLFGTKIAFKSVVAARAASLLAWASHHRGDRTGVVVFSSHGHQERRPRGGKSGVLRVLDVLARHHQQAREPHPSQSFAEEQSHSSFVSALARVTRTARPGSLIFLLSDFRNVNAQALPYLKQLSVHQDVVNVLVFDPLERDPPAAGVYRVTNGIDFGVLDSRSTSLIEGYRRQFRERLEFVEQLSRQHGMGFFSIGTHESIAEAVLQGLRNVGARRKHIPVGNGK